MMPMPTENENQSAQVSGVPLQPLVRLKIEVVGEDGDACRKILRSLCGMMDEDFEGAPGYSVVHTDGSAVCDVDTVEPNTRLNG